MTKRAPLKVLMTSVGNDAFPAIIEALRSNTEREVYIVGCDIRSDAPGLYIANRGYIIPSRENEKVLLKKILELCHKEGARLLYPLSTKDQEFFASNIDIFRSHGINVIVSSLDSLKIANNKARLCEFATVNGLGSPRFKKLDKLADLHTAAEALGFPTHPVVLKPDTGTGSQGVKVIHNRLNPGWRLIDRNNREVEMFEVERWLAELSVWPSMHLYEYLPGVEYSVDVLCKEGEVLAHVTRLRHTSFYGMATHAQVVNEPLIAELACRIIAKIGLSYVVNVQFKCDLDGNPKLMEINPRIPGTIGLTVAAGVNMPYLAIKLALGEMIETGLPMIGLHIMRYWTGIYRVDNEILS